MRSDDEAGQARTALHNCLSQLRALVAAGQIHPEALHRLERAMDSLSSAAATPPSRPVTATPTRPASAIPAGVPRLRAE